MRFDEEIGQLSVCVDCMFIHANGEYPGDPADRPVDAPEAWSLWGFGYHVTMGGDHADTCTDDDRAEGCDCEDLGFSWQSCEGCGSNLGGDRYRFTAWRTLPSVAHDAAREEITRSRDARVSGRPASAREHMTMVGMWRAYLADIAASDRRFANWRRSVAA